MVTLLQLEAHLWESANILCGTVDASDFKTYIFPLLFFKRISDVYDEERAASLAAYGTDFPESHRFQIPDGCHWQDIRTQTKNVGLTLQNAFCDIEKTNQATLYNIFGDAQWSNRERLSDELLINALNEVTRERAFS